MDTTAKRPRGRPPTGRGKASGGRAVLVRLTQAEHSTLNTEALRAGTSIPVYLREAGIEKVAKRGTGKGP